MSDRIGLLVKGNVFDADAAAVAFGIAVKWTHSSKFGDEMHGHCATSDYEAVARWFNTPGKAPFPPGTLLHFSLPPSMR